MCHVAQDVGFGSSEGMGQRGASLDKVCCMGIGRGQSAGMHTPGLRQCSQAKKEAVTDGLKRCLRLFGNGLGLCIYDKAYNNAMKRMPKQQVCALAFMCMYAHVGGRQTTRSFYLWYDVWQLCVDSMCLFCN